MRVGQTSVVHFASQLVSSLVGFLATVYLARVLGSEVLGTYFLFVAVLIWLQVLGNNGIRVALIKRLSEAGTGGEYLSAGLSMQAVVFLVLAGAVYAFRTPLDAYLGFPGSVPLVVLLLASLLLKLVAAVLEGQQQVHIASLLDPIDQTARSGLQIGAATLGYGIVGLLASYGAARVVAAVVGSLFVRVRPALPRREHVERLGSFAGYSWLTGIESRTFSSMDTIVLGFFVGSGLIGIYEIAWNLASVLAIFGASIAQSLFPRMSELSSRTEDRLIADLTTEALAYAGLFVIPGLVGVLVVGDTVLAIYGTEFTEGYLVLVVLVAARLVYVYESQLVNVLSAIDRPEAAFRVNLAFVGTNLLLNVVFVARFGWTGAAAATALSAVVGTVLSYYALQAELSVEVPVWEIARQWLAAGVMAVPLYFGRLALGDGTVAAVALVGGGAFVYFLALSMLSERFRTTVRSNLPLT